MLGGIDFVEVNRGVVVLRFNNDLGVMKWFNEGTGLGGVWIRAFDVLW